MCVLRGGLTARRRFAGSEKQCYILSLNKTGKRKVEAVWWQLCSTVSRIAMRQKKRKRLAFTGIVFSQLQLLKKKGKLEELN